jgi:hypothetical protein
VGGHVFRGKAADFESGTRKLSFAATWTNGRLFVQVNIDASQTNFAHALARRLLKAKQMYD